jgi:hypothetical protein
MIKNGKGNKKMIMVNKDVFESIVIGFEKKETKKEQTEG